ELHVSNDLLDDKKLQASWKLIDLKGIVFDKGMKSITAKALSSEKLKTLNYKKLLAEHGDRGLQLFLELKDGNKTVSSNFVSFVRPKHIELENPKIEKTIKQLKNGDIKLTIKSKTVALWTWIELGNNDAKFSDNFVHLYPNKAQTIVISPEKKLTLKEINKVIKVSSLFDTYE
ncbi:MAG: hypothetical protein HRT89_09625, partial [Lentisphaeria bacterium]|nr:hypothetical protein [Lentisphaeria bacterium]NQZ68320.1 hypothetical protein [Lentisphaeria bacterium]